MKALRKELRALTRKKHKVDLAQRRQHILPGIDLQMRAVLVFLLSASAELACTWAEQEQHRRPWHTFGMHVAVNVGMVGAWANQWATHAMVLAAVQNLEHPWRAAADVFLMESLLADRIRQMSASGLVMSSTCAWAAYLRYWSYRPQTPKQQAWLSTLQGTPRRRDRYLLRFRVRWKLNCGAPDLRPGLGMALLRERASLVRQLS